MNELITNPDKVKLFALERIETATIDSTFTDDHVLCVNATINGIKITLWWCGWEVAAAIKYSLECSAANKDAVKSIRNYLEAELISMFDETEEVLRTDMIRNRKVFERLLKYVRDQGPESSIWTSLAEYYDDPNIESLTIDVETMTLIC